MPMTGYSSSTPGEGKYPETRFTITFVKIWLLLFVLTSVRDRVSVGTRFSARPDRPWDPPSLLYNGYRVFPGGRGGRGVGLTPPPTHLVCRGPRQSRAIPLLTLRAFVANKNGKNLPAYLFLLNYHANILPYFIHNLPSPRTVPLIRTKHTAQITVVVMSALSVRRLIFCLLATVLHCPLTQSNPAKASERPNYHSQVFSLPKLIRRHGFCPRGVRLGFVVRYSHCFWG